MMHCGSVWIWVILVEYNREWLGLGGGYMNYAESVWILVMRLVGCTRGGGQWCDCAVYCCSFGFDIDASLLCGDLDRA